MFFRLNIPYTYRALRLAWSDPFLSGLLVSSNWTLVVNIGWPQEGWIWGYNFDCWPLETLLWVHSDGLCTVNQAAYSMHARIKSFCQDDILRQRGSEIQNYALVKPIKSSFLKKRKILTRYPCFLQMSQTSGSDSKRQRFIVLIRPLSLTYLFRNSLTDALETWCLWLTVWRTIISSHNSLGVSTPLTHPLTPLFAQKLISPFW